MPICLNTVSHLTIFDLGLANIAAYIHLADNPDRDLEDARKGNC
jgi:hypothetical protein